MKQQSSSGTDPFLPSFKSQAAHWPMLRWSTRAPSSPSRRDDDVFPHETQKEASFHDRCVCCDHLIFDIKKRRYDTIGTSMFTVTEVQAPSSRNHRAEQAVTKRSEEHACVSHHQCLAPFFHSQLIMNTVLETQGKHLPAASLSLATPMSCIMYATYGNRFVREME